MEILFLLWDYNQNKNINYGVINMVENVIKYVSANYQHQLTLKNLADVNGISVSYLNHIFKNVTSSSPFEFLIRYRIERACDFLANGVPAREAARMSGFNDIFYFGKCFKKQVGTPPGKYKKDIMFQENL